MPASCRAARSVRGGLGSGSALLDRFGCRLRRPPGLSSRIPWRLRPREAPPRASPRGRSLQSDDRWGSRGGPRARTRPQGLDLGMPLTGRERLPPSSPLSGGEKGLRRRAVRPGQRSASALPGRARCAQLRTRPAWLRPRSPGSPRGAQRSPPRDLRSVFPAHAAVQGAGPARPRRSPGSRPAAAAARESRRAARASSLLASPAAARSHRRRAGLPLPLSRAAALSGGAHRRAPPTPVAVLRAAGEAEYGSRPPSRRARHPARPDSARRARPPSCALKGGRGRSARMRAARLPLPRTSRGAGALRLRAGVPDQRVAGDGGLQAGTGAGENVT